MNVTLETKIKELLTEHPFLIDALPKLSSNFKKLDSVVLRQSLMAKTTLEDLAKAGGIAEEALIANIQGEIAERGARLYSCIGTLKKEVRI